MYSCPKMRLIFFVFTQMEFIFRFFYQHQVVNWVCHAKENLRARAHWPLCSTTCGRALWRGYLFPVGNHYFQALASTLQFVAQVCDRLWLVPATDRAFAYTTYMSPPHVALVCSGPPQCAATCGWTKWPVCHAIENLVPSLSFGWML